jgi:hypothetical protein
LNTSRKLGRSAFAKTISWRSVLAGVGFQDPQHFCDCLGVLMRTVARRDDGIDYRITDCLAVAIFRSYAIPGRASVPDMLTLCAR